MNKYFLAIDIGASSGRHIVGWCENGKISLKEIYRFDNKQIEKDGHLLWDMDNLWNGIINGLKAAKAADMIPETVAIDTWAVDYVLLDKNDEIVGDAYAYRDKRTVGIDEELKKYISEEELYERTGIQKQLFNTAYQLLALKKEKAEEIEAAETMLLLPDYFNFRLTGVKKQEYTNATSTNLINAKTKTWDMDIIKRLGLPEKLFGELSMPGSTVGDFLDEIAQMVGFSAKVILPATHDTGSAFLAVPASDDNSVYLSSGTWSLLGIENSEPITGEEARKENFTNEGGAWYRYRFLKNIMGLWIIQSIRRELNGSEYVEGRKSRYVSGREWSFTDLREEAQKYEAFESVIDVNSDEFLSPLSMIDAIKEHCIKSRQKVPTEVGEIMQCVYKGLAASYAKAVEKIEEITNKKITGIHIIGGGCQDIYLDELTAKATGLPVYAGPIEGTAIGNLVVQMISAGIFEDLSAARKAIFESFDIEKFI